MQKIKIGKNAIENLTVAMYEDSKIIYREYVQNAADSIDKGRLNGLFKDAEPHIDIMIDDAKRKIRIVDNAFGIRKSEIHQKLADVADSDKEKGIEKGFRGIGRLGGLAYCDTLRFITTYPGEDVETIMIWDAKELTRMLNDALVKYSAEEVLERIITYEEASCEPDDHYFIVELDNIRKENSELLNVEEVIKYISANAPIAYSNRFHFRTEIGRYMAEKGLSLSEYRVFVDGSDVFKDYSTVLYEASGNQKKKYDEIHSLAFKEFINSKGEMLAWMWYGLSAFERQIPSQHNPMRGIRLRKDNIQTGDSGTLAKFFKESRGNYYFIGELHAVHRNLVPNARRDYFNENDTRLEFEEEVRYFLRDKLHYLYYASNEAKNAFKKETQLIDRQAQYERKVTKGFVDLGERTSLEAQIRVAEQENEKAKSKISKLRENVKSDPVLVKVIDVIEKKHQEVVKDKVSVATPPSRGETPDRTTSKPTLITDNLHRLNREQRKLIGRVFRVIDSVLPPELSERLIEKIQDEFNK